MTIEIAAFRKQFTRRAALGGAAAMVAAPAFAEECRIGPPPHAKGPLDWMNMDQVELDAAYDQAFYAPPRLEVINRTEPVGDATAGFGADGRADPGFLLNEPPRFHHAARRRSGNVATRGKRSRSRRIGTRHANPRIRRPP